MSKKQLKNQFAKQAKRVAKALVPLHPDKIILFGSAAWGEPNENSDLDLLIIKSGWDRVGDSKRYYLVDKFIGDHEVPMDILVRTPHEIKKRLYVEDPFYESIVNEGKVIYGA